jgi:hypothetical protein
VLRLAFTSLVSPIELNPPLAWVKVGVQFNLRRNTMSKKQSVQHEPQEKNQPVNTLRLGRVKATIWVNKTEKGIFYSVQIVRIYRDEDQWKESSCFNRDDLPLVAKLADLAHTSIFEIQAAEE